MPLGPTYYFLQHIPRDSLRPMKSTMGLTGGIHLIRAAEAPKNIPHFINAYGVIKRGKEPEKIPAKKFYKNFG